MTKPCTYCGKPYEVRAAGRPNRFCSAECRIKWSKENRPTSRVECPICGILFDAASKRTYCSKPCKKIGVGNQLRQTNAMIKKMQEQRKKNGN